MSVPDWLIEQEGIEGELHLDPAERPAQGTVEVSGTRRNPPGGLWRLRGGAHDGEVFWKPTSCALFEIDGDVYS